MTSTRLPGKILKQVCGRPLLDYHVSRLLKSRTINQLIIATTQNSTDDPVADFCTGRAVACVRGSEEDVLARFHQVLAEYPADIVVRVTSDCPVIDPALLDRLVRYYIDHREQYDYVSLAPENFPRGLDVEVFSREALEEACSHGSESHEREHVTPYIYRKENASRCGILPSQETSGHHRWCVDEPADFELLTNILTAFQGRDDFSWRECLALFDENPDWFDINNMVHQKNPDTERS